MTELRGPLVDRYAGMVLHPRIRPRILFAFGRWVCSLRDGAGTPRGPVGYGFTALQAFNAWYRAVSPRLNGGTRYDG